MISTVMRLVAFPGYLLERVGERTVTDVMEQGGSQDGDLLVFGQSSALPLEAA